MSVNCNTK